MSGSYLLDTNIAIGVLNQEIDLAARRGRGIEALLCWTVVGELFFGVERSAHPKANRRRVERLVELCPVLPHDLDTARHYGRLKAALRQRGTPIPENDLWIAASALRHRLVLATRDRHFDHVEQLRVDSW
jgi:tRNA(fMet)-specific endonuclease VapC